MLDYIDIRETLELHALDLAFEKLDPEFLGIMLEGNTRDKGREPRLDNRLHQYWIDLAENRYLRDFFDQNAIYFDTLFARAVLDSETVAKRAGEHRVILQALLAKDLSKAKAALSKHILDQRHHVARLLEAAS
jgi:DNA-binding GntR family transcriptional regulator